MNGFEKETVCDDYGYVFVSDSGKIMVKLLLVMLLLNPKMDLEELFGEESGVYMFVYYEFFDWKKKWYV